MELELTKTEKISIRLNYLKTKLDSLKQLTSQHKEQIKKLEEEYVLAKLDLKILKKLDKMVTIDDEEFLNARKKLDCILEKYKEHVTAYPIRNDAEIFIIENQINMQQSKLNELNETDSSPSN